MDDELQKRIAAVRAGEAGAVDALVKALRGAGLPPAATCALLVDPHPGVREAAVLAVAGRTEEDVVAAIRGLVEDEDGGVRAAIARSIGLAHGGPLQDLLPILLLDGESRVQVHALAAAAPHPQFAEAICGLLRQDPEWEVRLAAATALESAAGSDLAFQTLFASLADDEDRDVSRGCAKSLERHLKSAGGWPATAPKPVSATLEAARERLTALGRTRFPRLVAWIVAELVDRVDPDKLKGFGADLTVEAEAGRLPRAHRVDEACDAVIRTVTGPAPRAVVLLGPPGSGKTAVLNEVVHRLRAHEDGPWRVLRVTPSDLLAGTVYLGEWQTKVRDLVDAIRAPKRVVLYVPNLAELAAAGRSSRSDLNVATMLAPHIESGAIALVGESTPEAFRSGLGGDASLRRLFLPVELAEADAEETREILQAVNDESALGMADEDLDRLLELAAMYMPGVAQPGRAVGLLRRVAETRGDRAGPVRPREVLETIATSTGVPVDFLDDEAPLDLARARRFLEERVVGQPEAVTAVLDLVALVKAGLSDPSKPLGVLLFIGPTGVGKTELARALAELLFGDSARLLRFDMSEYATPDSHERLIGGGSVPGLLTSAVREHPFAVVLFDEIEKAHINAYDLFLQVFDAGRLTDGQGVVADFRRTIVILTSNLGAAVASEPPVGFGETVPPPPNRDSVLREVLRFFRPEFVNRIDQIVTFKPLSLETAEKIARREVARVLERGGIARRRLTVDVDPGVYALLLREGYSPSFGARPLKRTVERLVLLPVAHAIARGGASPGSVLRLLARGDRVEAQVAAADAPEGSEPARARPSGPAPAPAKPAPGSSAAKARALLASAADLALRSRPLSERKAQLLTKAASPGFWDDPSSARRALDEIHRLERVVEAATRLEGDARGLAEAAASPHRRRGKFRPDDRIEALSRERSYVERLLGCRDARDLGDAYVRVSRVRAEGDDLDGVLRLARMYAAFAERRGYESEAVDDRCGDGAAGEDTIALLVGGAGAYATLAPEAGLHEVVRRREGDGKRGGKTAREWVRVEVLPAPAEVTDADRAAVRVRSKPLRGARGRLVEKPTLELSLLHEPSLASLSAVAAGPKDAAVARLLPLLLAMVQRGKEAPTAGGALVVRRYALGASPRVVDRRAGVATGHLDRVMRGELDLLLPPA